MQAIWSDTYYTDSATQKAYFIFSIKMVENDGTKEPVFYGKAWLNPSSSEGITINLNQYCRDYLKNDMADLLDISTTVTHTHNDMVKTFILSNENDVEITRYTFINDWSYTYKNYTNTPCKLSNPINGKFKNGMLGFYTYLDTDNKVKSVISPSITDLNDRAREALYKETDNCKAQYALYYSNRNGGWDSFLIDGKVIKNDTYQNYFTASNYNNNTIQFGKKVYHNVITTRYELHTGWLKDSESENLAFNLLPSNNIYLHNLKDDTIVPVIISNSETDYKTFRNQDNKLFNYTITVECSHKQHNL